MQDSRLGAVLVQCLALLLVSAGCGSSRQLQSVNVSPPVAMAHNYPNGQVQFTATGIFSKPPSPQPLTSKEISWCGGNGGTCVGNINTGVVVDQNGLASCAPNFTGTATIQAGAVATGAHANPDGQYQLKVYGQGQLVCP